MNLKKLLTVATLFVTSALGFNANAYTTDDLVASGWTKVESITDVANNYYVFVGAGTSESMIANVSGRRAFYTPIAEPLVFKRLVWILEGSGDHYALKGLNTNQYYNSGSEGWNCGFEDAKSTDYTFTLANGKYSLKASTGYLGPWNNESKEAANGELDVAANKSESQAPGFYIYSMPRATYEEIAEAYSTDFLAQMKERLAGKTDVNLTGYFSNLGFEEGNSSSWTSSDGGVVANNYNWNRKRGHWFVERWQNSNNRGLSNGSLTYETITLPKGVYTISADAQNIEQYNSSAGGKGYFLCVNETRVEIGASDNYSATVVLEEESNDVVIKFQLDGCTGNWISCDNVRIVYKGEGFQYTLATGRMEKSVAAAQTAAEAVFNADKSIDNYNALVAAIEKAKVSVALYENINASINNYASKAAALDAAGQAAYDASAIQAKYNNGDYTTLAEAETELQAAFVSAVKAQTTVGSDWTGVIVNPSFENNFTGWTNEGGIVTQSNTSFSLKQGNLYVEFWQPNGTKSISQTIANMPAGVYELSVGTLARGVTSAKVFAGGMEKAITIEDAAKTQTLEFACDAGDITIGLEAVCTGTDGSWIAADNFTLRLVSAGLPEVEAVIGKMNNAVANAQSSAIEVYNNNKTVENYNAAVNAINAANASVAAYVSAKAAIDRAKGVIGETNFYTQETYNAYNSAIAEAEQAYEDGTMEDATAAALENTLNGGTIYKPANVPMRDFYSSAWTATNGVSIYTNNWSAEGNGDGSNFLTPFIEDWVVDGESLANTTLTASVTVPTAGEYKVTARVRMRLKNGGTAPVSGLSVQVAGGEPVAISGEPTYNNDVFYVTDVEVSGFVAEPNGTLSVNFVVDGTNSSWLSIKALKYELVAEATAANMTITEAGWATFIAPFDVEIPEGVTAYTVEGVKVDNYLNKTALENVIPANTPVLLEGAEMNEKFYGQSTATQDTYGDVLVGNVSGAAQSVPQGSYVLQKNGDKLGFFYVNDDAATINNNRCYLNVPAGGEIKAFFFDDDATGISGIADDATVVERYNAAGMKVAAPVKGLNIVKLSNGKVQKILVK